MNLHPDDHVLLKRCGFSDAHIRKHAQKFYNLTHVCPLRENELRRMSELVAERRMLMDALEHLSNEAKNSPTSVISSTTVIAIAGSALAKARGSHDRPSC